MGYYTGTATSETDIITAIKNAATANGWTLSASGDILSKDVIYAQLSTGEMSAGKMSIGVQAGLGESSGVLTSPCNNIAGIQATFDAGGVPLTFPCTYHIFINTSPDEIVVAVNYNSLYWQWLGFGKANTIGVAGSGVYSWGSFPPNKNYGQRAGFNVTDAGGLYLRYPFFYGTNSDSPVVYYANGIASSHIYLNFDSTGWWKNNGLGVSLYSPVSDLLLKQPNKWNNESLIPRSHLLAARADGFWSYVAEFPHTRYTRNTYVDDAEVITLGTDNWFIAPIIKKDLANPDGAYYTSGSSAGFISGTNAFAIRKTV